MECRSAQPVPIRLDRRGHDAALWVADAEARTGERGGEPGAQAGVRRCLPRTPHAYWRDLVNTTTSRDVYIFAVHTTREQDQDFVQRVNALPNRNRYRTITYNCADFTRDMINLYFPHAVHRDVLNDVGMMGPKAAARSFTHYAARHRELGFYVLHFSQQPGVAERCGTARAGTEMAFHEPKYMLPAILIGDHEVAGSFLVAYFLTGRFGLQHTYERFAATPSDPHPDRAIVGTSKQWQSYRERFDGAVDDAVKDGILRSRKELREVFALLDRETIPAHRSARTIVARMARRRT